MVELIQTNLESCTGCNRCVRECPLETANITYLDNFGERKSVINYSKCIMCGRCVSACKHQARVFLDDTRRFFNDLSPGNPISLIAAPSLVTNVPEYKRLFTYLKQQGVDRIYDVSLGADICIWAHLRHIKETDGAPLIAQPCPPIVSYIEVFQRDLLPFLSPIHSPMACTAIFMREYDGAKNPIAALSPCIAKGAEFSATGLIDYNVTFANMLEWLEKNKIELPKEETDFDHNQAGAGFLFAVPGGMRENLELFIGTDLNIAELSGIRAYETLDAYLTLPAANRPDFFDVINCAKGCSRGSASTTEPCTFSVSKAMASFKRRTHHDNEKTKKRYKNIHSIYDTQFDLNKFKRTYKSGITPHAQISQNDIHEAFLAMGKDNYKKRNIDCSACGSDTCHGMARKIALKVNIPGNCVINALEVAQKERAEALRAHDMELQLAKMDHVLKAASIGLYDMNINPKDPTHNDNPMIFGDEFRILLGYENEQDFPNFIRSWVDNIHEDHRPQFLIVANAHLKDKTGKTPFDIEFKIRKKNGEYTWFRASGTVLRDAEGNPIRAIGAVHDVSDKKNLVAKADARREEAESASRTKSVFLSHISHEIRTPLNAILGTVDIEMQKNNAPELEEAFNRIYGSSRLLLDIINDLLDFSKIEAGKLEINPDEYNIPSLINDVIQVNTVLYASKGIQFILNINETVPLNLIGDELRIKQILNNLLSNAFKYTDEGEVEFSVESVQEDDRCVLIFRIRDTGQGMSEDQVSRLFDEYTRFNMITNRSIVGTGLGMTISKRIVELMYGSLDVKSKQGEGTVFTVCLPQRMNDKTMCGKDIVKRMHSNWYTDFTRGKAVRIEYEYMPYGKVLVVDDVESNLYVAKGLILPYGISVETAASGHEAIERITRGEEYDIVFMDHMMPHMDGIEATQRLRKMGYNRPIVALTANAIAGEADKFISRGFDTFISKPIDIRELDMVLIRLIRENYPADVVDAARLYVNPNKAQQDTGTPFQQALQQAAMSDIKTAIGMLESIPLTNATEDENILFQTMVHGVKSSLLNIKETALSIRAQELEDASRQQNHAFIAEHAPKFIISLRTLIEKLPRAADTTKTQKNLSPEDITYLKEKLSIIQEACRRIRKSAARAALDEVKTRPWSEEINRVLDEISVNLLHGTFKRIVTAIDNALEKL
ncbi:MAG: ATP-binding protein [Defluviitaleaceae bacterium]|nr:ATP-binding protein [Defluviitaleaceae bacterium]MCL2273562.1 ATP-binding protein [Defluviitaleaceae bacterium]